MTGKHKDIAILARAHTKTAIKTLAGIMEQPSSPEAARIKAAEVLLNRAYGMPKATIAGDAENPLSLAFQGLTVNFVKPDTEG